MILISGKCVWLKQKKSEKILLQQINLRQLSKALGPDGFTDELVNMLEIATPYNLSKNFKALKCTKIRGKFPVRFMSLYNAEHKAYIKHKNKNFVEKFHLNITANKNISANKKKSK